MLLNMQAADQKIERTETAFYSFNTENVGEEDGQLGERLSHHFDRGETIVVDKE